MRKYILQIVFMSLFSGIEMIKAASVFQYCEKNEQNQYYKIRLYKTLSLIHKEKSDLIISECETLSDEKIQLIDSLVCDSIANYSTNNYFSDYTNPEYMNKIYFTYNINDVYYVFINYSVSDVKHIGVGITFDGRPDYFETIINLTNTKIVYLK